MMNYHIIMILLYYMIIKYRTEIQDRIAEIQDRNTGQNTGRKYRTEIQDRNTGQNTGQKHRTKIQDRNAGQNSRNTRQKYRTE